MLKKNGLVKMTEECGELIQIAAKKMTCMDSDTHWDGEGSLKRRMEEEIADVLAATKIVSINFELDEKFIKTRFNKKLSLFRKWMVEEDVPVAKRVSEGDQYIGKTVEEILSQV